jgi:predicted methyltransferase
MPIMTRTLATLAVAALLTVAGCAGKPSRTDSSPAPAPPVAPAPVSDAPTLAAIDAAIAGDHRLEANRARDVYRHPRETLAFFGLRADMTVLEIWPGPAGWYTEILAPVLRERGRYIAAQWDPANDVPYFQEGLRAYRNKLDARPDVYDRVQVAALQAPNALQPVPAGSVDLVLTFRNLHNWMARDEARLYLEAMYAALKPGGILGVVEHRAPETRPQDPRARDGYVREDYAIELIRAAGFELLERSEVNSNPKDTKDHDQGVWTLPPTLRLGERDRDRYLAIGESDRFTLKFRKPGHAHR